MNRSSQRLGRSALALAICAFLALLAWFYGQGAAGRWMFDDEYSLAPLAKVTDVDSAIRYVFSGTTGPAGRPLALASFLPNAADWPANPAGFRRVNIAIHLLNAVLCFWLMSLLTRSRFHARSTGVALSAAALWAVSPFLASSVLSAVQRMTLLSATFVFLGLIGYVCGRTKLGERPVRGLLMMSTSLALCGVAGALCKENGALLPLFAGVIEGLLLADSPNSVSRRTWLLWQAVFLGGPIIVLAAYTGGKWPDMAQAYASRPFDLKARVMSETVILWDYVRNLLAPRCRDFGLFHDDLVALSANDPRVWVATTAWGAGLAAAWILRKWQPWLLFGLGGFLVGHLIESTIFPLELYYEHRNYVPAVFLYGGVAAMVWRALPTFAPVLASVFVVLNAVLLLGVTTLWGSSDLSAELWLQAHPNSVRAVQFAAQRYVVAGDWGRARQLVAAASERLPKASDLLLQRLQLECGLIDGAQIRVRAEQTVRQLQHSDRSNAVVTTLQKLKDLIDGNQCQGLTSADLVSFADVMTRNPQFRANAVAMDHLYNFLALSAWERGDTPGAEAYQRLAYRVMPSPDNAQSLAVWLLSQNKTDAAIDFLRQEIGLHGRPFWLGPNDWNTRVSAMLANLEDVRARSRRP